MAYRYYLTQRPPGIGAFPDTKDNGVIGLHSFDEKEYVDRIECKAYGYVCYAKLLTPKEVDDYELIEAKTTYTIQEIFEFPVSTVFLDSHGFEVAIVDIGDEDKELIGLWLEGEDKSLALTSAWMNEKFTKAEC